MKKLLHICVVTCVSCLLMPAAGMAGNGYMGGSGKVSVPQEPVVVPPEDPPPVDPPPVEPTDTGTITPDDKMADSGKLFGDLYVILRQQGIIGDLTQGIPADKKLVPDTNFNSTTDERQGFVIVANTGATDDPVIGGEPVLTVIDPPANQTIGVPFVPADLSDYGWYAAETINSDESITYSAAQSPFPAQCVQPIASYERWGDISSKTGLTNNRLPMYITYDTTHKSSECAVGLLGEPGYEDDEKYVIVDQTTGDLTFNTEEHFIQPCADEDKSEVIELDEITDECKWKGVAYPYGVLWTDLIGEVSFGRLNIGRAPEAVLQAAFDEAINTINSPDTIKIEIDAAGRLLLTKNVYDELRVYTEETLPADLPVALLGTPVLLGTVKKAIDSPLENVALYVKLMQDGHLVTPADEREPIDRSKNGGIPIWKMLELEDGPADAALRPTINIAKMDLQLLHSLVDVTPVTYLTYYQCVSDVDDPKSVTPCMCWDYDPAQPELGKVLVTCSNVVDRRLYTANVDECPAGLNIDNPITCEGPFTGIVTDGDYAPDATDLNFTAAFLSAAADKTGHISQDMVVYINSILGINKVVGSGDDDNNPATPDRDYSKDPFYFNFRIAYEYGHNTTTGRSATFNNRGDSGKVTVLQGPPPWAQTSVPIMGATMPVNFVETDAEVKSIFDDIGQDSNGFLNGTIAKENILGFTQQADDNLSVIRFIHTYQIPGSR